MYKEGEILITTQDVGKPDSKNFIKKGTKVTFVKVVDNENDLTKSLVAFNYGGKTLVTLETNLRIKSWWRRRQAIREFDKKMMKSNPRLRIYHYNPALRIIFKIRYFITDLFTRKK